MISLVVIVKQPLLISEQKKISLPREKQDIIVRAGVTADRGNQQQAFPREQQFFQAHHGHVFSPARVNGAHSGEKECVVVPTGHGSYRNAPGKRTPAQVDFLQGRSNKNETNLCPVCYRTKEKRTKTLPFLPNSADCHSRQIQILLKNTTEDRNKDGLQGHETPYVRREQQPQTRILSRGGRLHTVAA